MLSKMCDIHKLPQFLNQIRMFASQNVEIRPPPLLLLPRHVIEQAGKPFIVRHGGDAVYQSGFNNSRSRRSARKCRIDAAASVRPCKAATS